jgi:hypothetical protein
MRHDAIALPCRRGDVNATTDATDGARPACGVTPRCTVTGDAARDASATPKSRVRVAAIRVSAIARWTRGSRAPPKRDARHDRGPARAPAIVAGGESTRSPTLNPRGRAGRRRRGRPWCAQRERGKRAVLVNVTPRIPVGRPARRASRQSAASVSQRRRSIRRAGCRGGVATGTRSATRVRFASSSRVDTNRSGRPTDPRRGQRRQCAARARACVSAGAARDRASAARRPARGGARSDTATSGRRRAPCRRRAP